MILYFIIIGVLVLFGLFFNYVAYQIALDSEKTIHSIGGLREFPAVLLPKATKIALLISLPFPWVTVIGCLCFHFICGTCSLFWRLVSLPKLWINLIKKEWKR